MLVLGLALRFIMREGARLFRVLAVEPNEQAQRQLERAIGNGRIIV